jgi:hypothetical protein
LHRCARRRREIDCTFCAAPGTAFDESYVSGFAARAQKQDRTLSKWLQSVVTTYDVKADPATHQVNCIFHFAKPAQSVH